MTDLNDKTRQAGRHGRKHLVLIIIAAFVAVVTAIIAVDFTNLHMEGKHMNQQQGPIVRESADISQERIDKGRVQSAQLGGTMDFGDVGMGVPHTLGKTDGHYSINPVIGSSSDRTDDLNPILDLELGKTVTVKKFGCSVTLIKLIDFDGVQGITVLVEPYHHGPVTQQSANIPQEQLAQGRTSTAALGETIDFGDVQADLPYGLGTRNGDDTSAHIVVRRNHKSYPMQSVDLRLGETKTTENKTLGFKPVSLTLVALTNANGFQGITLLETTAAPTQ
ncbi:hypothetical protein [Bifidobacterium sp. ESL0704]|uniref:hypothetical protein n=1 Tax=Bifidobacterium sp. ESL0704 TaxID=2983219 RepID=UPI0023F71EDE|nr:hypothetical protein [Bifidobacterium sp. ESL0704]WEV52838.1 hypothetical protein OZX64_08280 [Bifidobacterium sp. ESL0704]